MESIGKNCLKMSEYIEIKSVQAGIIFIFISSLDIWQGWGPATRALVLARTKSESIPLFKQMVIQLSRTQEKYRNSHASSGQQAAGNYKHLGFKWKMVQKRNRNLAASKIQKCGIQNFERV